MLFFSVLLALSPKVFASNYSIIVSENPDRSNSVSLESNTLTGLAYIQVMSDPSIDKVNFYLDSSTGTPYQTEGITPYDMSGTNNDGTASALDTTELHDGSHYIHASIVLTDGSVITESAHFNINNSFSLVVSQKPDRSSSAPLDSSTLSGLAYIHVMDAPNIEQVNFYLDSSTGTPYQTEGITPYDMSGTNNDGTAGALNTTELLNGSHYIVASIILSDGSEITDIAYFNVNNAPPPTEYMLLDIHINGQGVVKELNSGLECRESSCSFKFEAGTSVHLSATSENNTHEFSAWEGICEGKNDCIFSIDYDNTITALFNEQVQDTPSKSSPYFSLVFNNTPDRDNPLLLQSSNLSDNVYIELLSDIEIKRVAFFLDLHPDSGSSATQIENVTPYDFSGTNGDKTPRAFDTSSVSSGAHTLYALVTLKDGTETEIKSEFIISNTDSTYPTSDKNIISWVAPSERENGAEITPSELSKHIIYYGTRSETYTGFIEISKKINNVLITSASVNHLEPGVVYYFSGISVDSNGLESGMSNEISKLIEP